MPFTSSWMPAMGVGRLKGALINEGYDVDVFYGTAEFFKFFNQDIPPRESVLDYNLLASFRDLGNLFFADALWGASDNRTAEQISHIGELPVTYDRREVKNAIARLQSSVSQSNDFIEHCFAARNWADYEFIGFSSTFSQNISSLALAKRIAAEHSTSIVFGGANCDGAMGKQLISSFSFIDAVIQGEADHSIVAFAERKATKRPLHDVPGILLQQESGIFIGPAPMPVNDMDALARPRHEDFFDQMPNDILDYYRSRGELAVPVETSRGCWWGAKKHCVFCGLNLATMNFRAHSADRACEEICDAQNRYQLDFIYMVDNIMDRSYIRGLLPRLKDRGLRIFYETKSNLKEKDVAVFRDAGVTSIQPGIEALSTPLLELMDKGVTASKNVEALKWLATYDIDVSWMLLYGLANESTNAYLETIDLIPRLVHLPPPKAANPIIMDRFSPYFTKAAEFGFTNIRPAYATEQYYRGLNEEERYNLTYHFCFDLPQGNCLPYLDELRQSVDYWITHFSAGARLEQLCGDTVSLIVDTRSGNTRSFLLTHIGHRVFQILRVSHHANRIPDICDFKIKLEDFISFSATDIRILHAARELKAKTIESPTTEENLQEFLDKLDSHRLTATIDGRTLSLALDSSPKRGRTGDLLTGYRKTNARSLRELILDVTDESPIFSA